MKVLGLTGGIGSGKSTVAAIFQELGVPVYIADLEARKLMQEDSAVKQKILELFGKESFKNGLLNRNWIAGQVFTDRKKLDELNSIVHPAVAKHFESWKEKQKAPYVVYEAAILFEKGGYKKCDFSLLITAPLALKMARIQKRDGSSIQEIQDRMANQWSDEKKAGLADFLIENIELQKTREAVVELHQTLLESA